MHFLFLFLAYTQVVLSNPFPNIWARGVNTLSNLNPLAPRDTSYTVYPTDPSNTDQVVKTETFLRGLYGKEHVKVNRNQDGPVSWSIYLKDGDTTDQLEGHQGLRLGEEEGHPKSLTGKSKPSEIVPRDDPFYIAIAADPEDDKQTKKTREFLDSKVADPNTFIIELHKPGTNHIMAWANLQLNDAAKADVEGYEGIKAPLGDDSEMTDERAVTIDEFGDLRAVPRDDESGFFQSVYKSVEKRAAFIKRAMEWTKQPNADDDLVMVSQPEEMKDLKLKDFVYDKNAGGGAYVYVIDAGAAYNNENDDGDKEFEKAEPLQTEASKNDGEKEDEDGSAISHGTMVSSKAVGKKYGVAKAATLVSVKLRANKRKVGDFLSGLELVTKHLEGEPDRHLKTVVTSSLGFGIGLTHGNVKNNPDAILMRSYLEQLFGWGVPFISSSGNYGHLNQNIDRLPKVLEDPDTPIINVGAIDKDGNKREEYQAGPQLTISAPGVDIVGQSKENGKSYKDSGTSFAAPLVAGIIATYLNYDPPPWDGTKTGKARVQAIKDYIVTDASSWVRKVETGRVIWNGATKADHASVGANSCEVSNSKSKRQDNCGSIPPPPPPPARPTCNGYGPDNNKYADRARTLSKLVDTFCPDAAAQGGLDANSGSIVRTYNKDTPEQIDVAMDWTPGLGFKPDEQKCKDIMTEITDSCDTNSGQWKGGGEKMDGEVKYRWNVVNTRSPFGDGKAWGGCEGGADWFSTKYTIWGSKFVGDDFGKAIIDGISGKGVSPTDWEFHYGGGDDHREWTATVNTIAGAEYAVEPVVEGLGGIDIECK